MTRDKQTGEKVVIHRNPNYSGYTKFFGSLADDIKIAVIKQQNKCKITVINLQVMTAK